MNFDRARSNAVKEINKQLGLKLEKTMSIKDMISMIDGGIKYIPENIYECYSFLIDVAEGKYKFINLPSKTKEKKKSAKKEKTESFIKELTSNLRKRLYFSYNIESSPDECLESLILKYCSERSIKIPQKTEGIIKLAKDLVGYTNHTNKKTKIDKRIYVSAKTRREFYNSPEWKSLRYAILKEQGGRCQCCGRTAQDGVTLCVAHITPLSKDWSRRLDRNNLQVLCDDCNSAKSDTDCIDWRRKR